MREENKCKECQYCIKSNWLAGYGRPMRGSDYCSLPNCPCHSSSTETNYLEVGTHVHCYHCHYTILREDALEHFDLHRESKPTPCESVLNCPRLVTPPEKEETLDIMVRDFTSVGKCSKSEVRRRIKEYLTSHTEQIAERILGMIDTENPYDEGTRNGVYERALRDVLKIIRGTENV
jgi:hypothetical protein